MTRSVKYRPSTISIGIRALVVLACIAAMGVHAQASSCSADCVRRMADCSAERCAGVPKKLCRDRCRAITGCRAGGARIRTVAMVVSDCQVAGGRWTAQQRLEIKRGDCPAQTVMTIDSDPVSDAYDPTTGESLCERYGRFRDGATAVVVGAFQRLGVSPDGDTVLFELNTHVADPAIAGPQFRVQQEGIFAVGPRGDVRLLGGASAEPAYQRFTSPNVGETVNTYHLYFTFSPNGRYVAFSDRGPGKDGSDAAQIVVMKLPKGDRTQVTQFDSSHQTNLMGPNVYAVFLDDDTLGVFGYGEPGSGFFTVHPDGSGFEPIEVPPLTGGGSIVQAFGIAGPVGTTVAAVFSPEPVTEPVEGHAQEILLYGGPNRLLQLTRFGRSDTSPGPSLNTGDRVFFIASVDGSVDGSEDGFGQNPMNTCQLFSIDRFGGRLRQLTPFAPQAPSSIGCLGGDRSPLQCRVAQTAPPQYDARARALVFDGTCDLYGLEPVGGQVFAMGRDGSGLRQLTTYRGMHGTAAAGTLSVELPGPIATSGEVN